MKHNYQSPIYLCFLILCAGLLSCQSTHSVAQTSSANTAMPTAPWTNLTIKDSQTEAIYRKEWAKSKSKSLCPILALPRTAGAHISGHRVRRADFSSGWGVAYDLPDMRSAYGVANTGTIKSKDISFHWPYNMTYQDGSIAGYGHEGGNPSAQWLAYLVIPQNNCFYNVWSGVSKEHLEHVISDLRKVRS